jgi:diphosphomevalonate decarboxylase
MKTVIARAPVNIALIKYWGKANEAMVLPTTASLSLTLTDLFTETTFEPGPFAFYLNHKLGSEEEVKRVKSVLQHFQSDQVIIRSTNNFPTASGLASSASGMAALTVGLNAFFDAQYTFSELVTLTRLGSGSACRSLVDGFALWDQQGKVRSIPNPFPALAMIVMVVSDAQKAVSSRNAMKLTQATSPIYQQWIADSEKDLSSLLLAIEQVNFDALGSIMEQNSARLHQVMASSHPPIVYQQEASLTLLKLVAQARMAGLIGYTTMDAGPNVKILVQQKDVNAWQDYLNANTQIKYLVSRIGGFAHAE